MSSGRQRAVLVVPVHNEAAAVPAMSDVIRTLLSTGVVNSAVVADGGSTDGTQLAVRDQGLNLVETSDHGAGPVQGKGDNVYRAVRALLEVGDEPDVVLLMDGDVTIEDPRRWGEVVAAASPQTPLVKAAFERVYSNELPLADRLPGGRVTDLVARPLLRLAHPQLARLAQPLSGQVAIHRTAFDRLRWFSHYGLEMGMLLSLDASHISEVHIGRLRHRGRPDSSLAATAQDVVDAYAAVALDTTRPGTRISEFPRLENAET